MNIADGTLREGGVSLQPRTVQWEANHKTTVLVHPGSAAEILGVVGCANHSRTAIGEFDEFRCVPRISEFTGNVETVHGDEVGLAQAMQQVRGHMRSGTKLHPHQIWIKVPQFLEDLMGAALSFGQCANVLACEFAAQNMMKLLWVIVELKMDDICSRISLKIGVSAESSDFTYALQQFEVVSQKCFARADGGIAQPSNLHAFSKVSMTCWRSSTVSSGNMGIERARCPSAKARGWVCAALAFHLL